MNRFLLRETTPDDSTALNLLYRKHTGIGRSHEEFLWEWFLGPYGPARSWVIIDRATHRIAAHHGVIRCSIWFNGHVIWAARTENSMVDPEYRGQVMYVSYEAVLLKKLLEEFDLVFTTTGKGIPGAIRKRLGYRSIGHWCSFVIHEPPSYIAARFAGKLAGRVAFALTPKRNDRQGAYSFEPTEDTDRIAALWDRSRTAYEFAPQRDAAFLRWRLMDNPYNQAQLAIVTKEGEDFGFVAWSDRQSRHSGREVLIEDIFCTVNDAPSYVALLATLRRALNFPSARIVLRTVKADSPLCIAARSSIPRRFKQHSFDDGAELLVRTRDPIDLPVSTMTMLITEGID